MSGIDWQPIASIPTGRKDGRGILLWQGGDMIGPDIGTCSVADRHLRDRDDPIAFIERGLNVS
jgi:hypothetical protein